MKTAKTRTPVTPVKQAIVYIAGFPVLAVLLSDGRVAAVFRTLCELLRLNYSGQVRRVQKHPIIADLLMLAYIDTAGGIQEANIIIGEAISIWLAGIQLNQVAPAARETVKEVQLGAFNTIRRKFFPDAVEAPKSQLPPKEPQPRPLPNLSLGELLGSASELIAAELVAVSQELQAIKGRLEGTSSG